jgi:hypothetical protein
MAVKTLNESISEALMQFFQANGIEADAPPEHLVEAIREEVQPAIDKYKAGKTDHKAVGEAIWGTAMYVLRDMTNEETEQYSSLMYGAIGSHGHLDK